MPGVGTQPLKPCGLCTHGARTGLLLCSPHLFHLEASSVLDTATTLTSSWLLGSHLLYGTLLSWGCMLEGCGLQGWGGDMGAQGSDFTGKQSHVGVAASSVWGCF